MSPEPTIDIIVPTLGRAHRIEPLILNVAEATPIGRARVLFVADRDDHETRDAIAAVKAKRYRNGARFDVLVHDGTYPQKINAGVDQSLAQLVCLSGDDAVWHPGWLEAATAAVRPGVSVVGTRDMTPSSADGTHSTQPIVRRSYIAEVGGAWGNRGLTYHEGYHHNFCETELCALAQHRGVWAFEPSSVIEHRHPDWGTAEHDATYEKGAKQNWSEDAALFALRRAEWSRS